MPQGTSRIRTYALVVLAGLCAVVVLMLSWPRLQASLLFLPVDTALSQYHETRQIEPAQADALAGRAREALAKYDHYRYWEGLSELQVLASQDADKPYYQRRQILEQAVVAATEAVKRAPARPRTWLRIARARAALGRPGVDVIQAWKMSVLTGRVEPTLMLARLKLGFRFHVVLDNDLVNLLRDQTVLTWSVQKRSFMESMDSGSLDPGLVRGILSGFHPDIIAEMEAG